MFSIMLASRPGLFCEICLGASNPSCGFPQILPMKRKHPEHNNPERQTLTAPSKLGTDGGIVAPTEMRFVPPAREAGGYPEEAENKRGGAIIHIGKMIRTSLPPAIVSHLKMSLNTISSSGSNNEGKGPKTDPKPAPAEVDDTSGTRSGGGSWLQKAVFAAGKACIPD
ncbi:hypothetical protein C8J56DRAFT_896725 [Mycena floridula]|nr:hypothetical protein C8J56DRAFT_898455 [Mycena floridula]KAJ7580117.1 hypothetical protein C8J56DRAFT_896725 [Mycena floridula]